MGQNTNSTVESCETAPQSVESGYRGRFVRDLFTGQLVERFDDPQADFARLNERARQRVEWMARGRRSNPWDTGRDHVSRPMSIPPEQATPERIARENEEAKRHGTGAYYTLDGACHTPGRGSRSREMQRRNRMDNDAGYSDYAGR